MDTYTIKAITGLVEQAYNAGLLQHYPLMVHGLTVTMTMGRTFNTLVVASATQLQSVGIYDTDSEHATQHAILDLVESVVR